MFDDVRVKVKTLVAAQGGTLSDDELPEGGGPAASVVEAPEAVVEAPEESAE